MITADSFLSRAMAHGYDFVSCVPCSFLTPLIDGVVNDRRWRYVSAASEGEALAIAAGAWLAGRKPIVMCQNSGLGNMVNPLTSLNYPFRIPTLLVVTWRGQPSLGDEPQHELMGQITGSLLDVLQVRHRPFPLEEDQIGRALAEADEAMALSERPFALVMAKGAVTGVELQPLAARDAIVSECEDLNDVGEAPSRAAVLESMLQIIPSEAAVIATTGKCGRELFTLGDRRQHLYQVGSMGCASGMALGVALHVNRSVIVLDGDGAALMKLGTFATIGASGPRNLLHIVLDNGVHDSTGGQPTASSIVSFGQVARGCGYRWIAECRTITGFEEAFRRALRAQGPRLIHMKIRPGSLAILGRPSISPAAVARRFREFLATEDAPIKDVDARCDFATA